MNLVSKVKVHLLKHLKLKTWYSKSQKAKEQFKQKAVKSKSFRVQSLVRLLGEKKNKQIEDRPFVWIQIWESKFKSS